MALTKDVREVKLEVTDIRVTLQRWPLALLLALTIPGCGSGQSADVKWQQVVAVDLAATRCLEPSEADRAEANRYVGPPKPGADGKVSDDAHRAKYNEMRQAIVRKNGVIRRDHGEIDQCRGKSAPTS